MKKLKLSKNQKTEIHNFLSDTINEQWDEPWYFRKDLFKLIEKAMNPADTSIETNIHTLTPDFFCLEKNMTTRIRLIAGTITKTDMDVYSDKRKDHQRLKFRGKAFTPEQLLRLKNILRWRQKGKR